MKSKINNCIVILLMVVSLSSKSQVQTNIFIDTVNIDNNYRVTKCYQIVDSVGFELNRFSIVKVYNIENNIIESYYLNRNGEIEGNAISYYKSGKIKNLTMYINGLRAGSFLSFFSNGSLESIGNYNIRPETGIKYDTIYEDNYETGVKEINIICNDILNRIGNWIKWDSTGVLLEYNEYPNAGADLQSTP